MPKETNNPSTPPFNGTNRSWSTGTLTSHVTGVAGKPSTNGLNIWDTHYVTDASWLILELRVWSGNVWNNLPIGWGTWGWDHLTIWTTPPSGAPANGANFHWDGCLLRMWNGTARLVAGVDGTRSKAIEVFSIPLRQNVGTTEGNVGTTVFSGGYFNNSCKKKRVHVTYSIMVAVEWQRWQHVYFSSAITGSIWPRRSQKAMNWEWLIPNPYYVYYDCMQQDAIVEVNPGAAFGISLYYNISSTNQLVTMQSVWGMGSRLQIAEV